MQSKRWWDVAVGAVLLAMAVYAALDGGFARRDSAVAIAVCLTSFAAGYVVLGRPALFAVLSGKAARSTQRGGRWRGTAFLAIAAASIGVGVAGAPMMATLQAVAYPLAWMLTANRKQAVVACAAISTCVLLGVALGLGGTGSAWVAALITSGFSFVFAVALGLWITRIAEYGEERARLVEELTAAQAQVAALSRDRGAADERERLARDIHDTLAQTLAGLVIVAERAGRQSRDGRADAAAQSIATIEQVARDALAEARALVAQTAAVPAEPAFAEAVARLVERFRAEAGLVIDVRTAVDEPPPDRDAQVVLLRCLQEALANVRKHAGATRITVRVTANADGSALLEVRDDGHGFEVAAPRSGFGLDGMSERVALAGGELDITSGDAGTTLIVRLPAAREGIPS